jgi:hypothetical protein
MVRNGFNTDHEACRGVQRRLPVFIPERCGRGVPVSMPIFKTDFTRRRGGAETRIEQKETERTKGVWGQLIISYSSLPLCVLASWRETRLVIFNFGFWILNFKQLAGSCGLCGFGGGGFVGAGCGEWA